MIKRSGYGITAVLGPTNTGKTHLAIERLLAHRSCIIGLPLRLLAREVYDRIRPRCGAERVALITGEEKIIPANPAYFVCTVESMPLDHASDFMAIDEIQLSADAERGHVFTRRLLHARGLSETMLLGADTMRPLIAELLPGANFVSRPRFSSLSYAGRKKLSRLPRRSAIVAFSAQSVYETAELVRRQRGGAAVVMGALSPRTRNAQVELFQSGDVDFLVATDAIGMGLNMEIDHVAFAATRKFDGRDYRQLSPAELAQIAGRAGRHMNDGSFGETANAPDFHPDVISRIENHEFDSIKCLQWRNTELDFTSMEALFEALNRPPARPGLVRARIGADQQALEILSRDAEVTAKIRTPEDLALLWEICQLPDYRKIAANDHSELIAKVFEFLVKDGHIPQDWFAGKIRLADKTDGNIDTLANRISYIRTWTFIANHAGWLDDQENWRSVTRKLEDRLSDALHQKLVSRFVDRRTSVLMKSLREKEELMAAVTGEGDVIVEGETIGSLKGFVFIPQSRDSDIDGKALRAAANTVLAKEIPERAARLIQAPDSAFSLNSDGAVMWEGQIIAHLKAGETILAPAIEIAAGEHLGAAELEAMAKRLQDWLESRIAALLEPLLKLRDARELTGLARGVAFRLAEHLGLVDRQSIAEDIRALDQDARGELRKYGVRFGAYSIYLPMLLKPAAASLRRLLWALFQGAASAETLPEPPGEGLTSVKTDPALPRGYYEASGFKLCGLRAVRVDMLERLADEIRPLVYWKGESAEDKRPEGSVEGGGFTVTPTMMSFVGCSGEDFAEILRAIGFRCQRRKIEVTPESEKSKEKPPAPAEPAPVSAAPEPAVAESAAAEPAPAEPEDEKFIEIWRPVPVKKHPPHRPRKPHRRGEKTPPGAKSPPPRGGRKQTGKKPAAKPDPNSPFAALQALKARMEKSE